MPEEIFVVSISRGRSGTRGMFLTKEEAVEYSEQAANNPEVTYVEVRAYGTLDLLNAALDEMEDAAREDPEVENGELIATFR